VLKCISNQTIKVNQVIVIDSSDSILEIEVSRQWEFSFLHKHVKIKSAAIQRNIGLDHVFVDSEFLCFLDDDVLPNPDYLLRLVSGLNKVEAVGISGIALNPSKHESMRQKPKGLFGSTQRIFGLDSNCDGKLLRSGVNIPVRTYSGPVQNVDWLIGCSVWRYSKILDLRFESDFLGQSLSEDVIFSVRASKRGQLLVDPNVHLAHSERCGL
jgi:GT2 family glycosyltransferase